MAYTTQQKLMISRVIEASDRPLTPAEICEEARKELPELGIATVYRAIRRFVSDGSVRVVEVPGTSPHYEHSSRRHHHFFLCRQCRRIFNLLGCLRGVDAMAPEGFEVERHEIVLYGQCPGCLSGS
jgi:Fur family ferric uptake transcriptional regulator